IVGIVNLLAADMLATISCTALAVRGDTTSVSSHPSAASVAARVVAESSALGTAATAGRAKTAAINATDIAKPRFANRDLSSSRARDKRRDIEPSGQPSCAAAWALVFPSK